MPVQLAHLPTVGGLVVPWITAVAPDGRAHFGHTLSQRIELALWTRLCQVCGRTLDPTFVFAMRDSDVAARNSKEPAMHPVCARYAATACPMLQGRRTGYQAKPITVDDRRIEIVNSGDPSGIRADEPAEPWHLVWANGYQVRLHSLTGTLTAQMTAERMLRVRPISRR
ncbi:hypothetical protein AB0B66_10435 [Catellatospora sp. NPDC049111]|uniref:hypothetical protein n=1 Tax=Catellatospora sp. NPDC049111 TaxID=3155271 RepID=UPI0034024946